MNQQTTRTVELDVRPHLRKKLEPFQLIMNTVKSLEKGDVFVLHATFKPTPLLGLMKTKGFVHQTEKAADDHWIVTFVHKKNKHRLEETRTRVDEPEDSLSNRSSTETAVENGDPTITELDNRGLEPPQPMVRTLSALERSRPGDEVIIHNDRVPVFLIDELNNLGYRYTVEEQPDGSAKVRIQKS